MRILLTGNRGRIGPAIQRSLQDAGHEVRGFDKRDGSDFLNARAVGRAVAGCDAVVHLALCESKDEAKQLAENVKGTWNVMRAAAAAGVRRAVYMSSVNALGGFKGRGRPLYLPYDDDHPANPASAYGLTKLLGEEVCLEVTNETGMSTVCLRPPAVWSPDSYGRILERRRRDPSSEWSPFWEYGAFIDVRDLAAAVLDALICPDPGHARLLLCAPDISTSGERGRDMAARLLPGVPWRGGPEYDTDPSLPLVRTDAARRVLGWTPRYSWRAFLEGRQLAK